MESSNSGASIPGQNDLQKFIFTFGTYFWKILYREGFTSDLDKRHMWVGVFGKFIRPSRTPCWWYALLFLENSEMRETEGGLMENLSQITQTCHLKASFSSILFWMILSPIKVL